MRKLTKHKIGEIRKAINWNILSNREIARMFNISETSVRKYK